MFDATLPVKSVSASTGDDIRNVASVLLRYSEEVRDIQARLEALQGRAAEFEADMRLVEDPGAEQAYVDQNNEVVSAVNAAVADFEDAQRRCANAINALYRSAPAFRPMTGTAWPIRRVRFHRRPVRRRGGALGPARTGRLVGFHDSQANGLFLLRSWLLADHAVPLLELDGDTLVACGLDYRWGFILQRFEHWGPVEHEMDHWSFPYN